MATSAAATFDEDETLKTPTGQKIDTSSFAEKQATPHAHKPDLGKKISNQSRKDVAQAMNSEMLVCEIIPFLAKYGPSPDTEISQDVIDGCKTYLLGQEILKKKGNDWTWTGFPTSPANSKKTEIEAFDPLAEIVKGIWDFAEKVQKKKRHPYELRMVPKSHIDASIPGTNHMMDACVVEASYKDLLVTNNAIMPFEMKNKWNKTDQIQVREQLAGDCHHVLCDDPRRMFIFGATMEDDRFSLWYFSRTHSVKALAFQWLSGEGIDMFIRVMLAFAYATPKDWGLDPNVYKPARLDTEDGQRYVYIFEVDEEFNPTPVVSAERQAPTKGKSKELPSGLTTRARQAPPTGNNKKNIYYRTIRGRIPMRPICISGRTTRVWEVIQVRALADPTPVPGAVPVILKDVWLDALSETEAENQDALFSSVDQFVADGLKAHPGPDGLIRFINSEPRFKHFNDRTKERLATLLTAKNYRNLFLTQVLAWQGELTKPRDEDNAFRPTRPIFMLPSTDGKPGDQNLTSHATPSHLTVPETAMTSAVPLSAAVIARRNYSQKRQFRVVYEEVCKEIYDVTTFGDVVDVTRQALDALQILFCAGWVHRDISTGNILVVPVKNESGETTRWTVKLSDLEFSKRLGYSDHRTDPRTGTPYFMPVEIMSRKYFAREFYTGAAIYNMDLVRDGITDEDPMLPASNNLADKYLTPNHPDYAHYCKFRHDPNLMTFTELPTPYDREDIPEDYVRHNYQHDLESIWWILLYFLTACAGSLRAEVYSKTIFLRYLNPTPRAPVLEKNIESTFIAISQRPLKRVFGVPLEKLRSSMHLEYIRRAICGQMSFHDSYSFIHAQFAEQLDAILDENVGNWKAMNLVRMKVKPHYGEQASYPLETNKRGADDDAAAGVAEKKARIAR